MEKGMINQDTKILKTQSQKHDQLPHLPRL
jgi:hypothetical protein